MQNEVTVQPLIWLEKLSKDYPSLEKDKELLAEIYDYLSEVQKKMAVLEEQNKHLIKLDKIRTQLISTVSHELRTPLVSIMGFSAMLKRHELTGDLVRESSEQINAAGLRLSRMIDDFIELNRADTQGWNINFEPLDFAQLIESVASTLSPINKKHNFVYDFSADLPQASGDRKLLRQVIDNLLINAIKYSPEGGDIVLKLAVQGNKLMFTIQDQGIGIAPEEKKRIFERFYRVQNKYTEVISGVGLGLSICKDMIEAHHGEINCDSEPSKGSCFVVLLPIHKRR